MFYVYKKEYERSLKAAKCYNVCQRKRNRILYSDSFYQCWKKSASINLAFLKKDKVCWVCDNNFFKILNTFAIFTTLVPSCNKNSFPRNYYIYILKRELQLM